MEKIRAITFDMDGVLLDSEPYILEAAQRMLRERHGIDVPATAFTPYVGRGEDAFLGGPAAEYGATLNMPEDKNYTYEIYLDAIKGRLDALDGVHEFIAGMKARGIPLAIFSSADRMKVDGNLREIGLSRDDFRVILTGSDIENKKPHPEGYAKAAEVLGIAPGQTLVVEDAVSGIKAGRAAGCQCLGITSSSTAEELRAAGAGWVASDLGHIPDDLKALLAGSAG